jgi:hypothetical protein
MFSTTVRRVAAATAALITVVSLLTTAAVASATGASHPQHRQIAVTTLSDFKVVVTAIRDSHRPLLATVTAAGFRRSGGHWQLISTKRIGKANQWFWFATDACSLATRQLKGLSPVKTADSIKIRLLVTPAIGCAATFTKTWQP